MTGCAENNLALNTSKVKEDALDFRRNAYLQLHSENPGETAPEPRPHLLPLPVGSGGQFFFRTFVFRCKGGRKQPEVSLYELYLPLSGHRQVPPSPMCAWSCPRVFWVSAKQLLIVSIVTKNQIKLDDIISNVSFTEKGRS